MPLLPDGASGTSLTRSSLRRSTVLFICEECAELTNLASGVKIESALIDGVSRKLRVSVQRYYIRIAHRSVSDYCEKRGHYNSILSCRVLGNPANQ
jgi:hypothetical protein